MTSNQSTSPGTIVNFIIIVLVVFLLLLLQNISPPSVRYLLLRCFVVYWNITRRLRDVLLLSLVCSEKGIFVLFLSDYTNSVIWFNQFANRLLRSLYWICRSLRRQERCTRCTTRSYTYFGRPGQKWLKTDCVTSLLLSLLLLLRRLRWSSG